MKPDRVQPLSRQDLRRLAESIRAKTGYANDPYFPILRFVELVLPELRPNFDFEVVSKQEMGNTHGLTFPEQEIMQIREDVYERACQGSGRDRMTVAHELGHYLLHRSKNVVFARTGTDSTSIPVYCQPEWQANAFGGELLIPSKLVWDKSPDEIARLCGVSLEAANYQKSRMERGKKKSPGLFLFT